MRRDEVKVDTHDFEKLFTRKNSFLDIILYSDNFYLIFETITLVIHILYKSKTNFSNLLN